MAVHLIADTIDAVRPEEAIQEYHSDTLRGAVMKIKRQWMLFGRDQVR